MFNNLHTGIFLYDIIFAKLNKLIVLRLTRELLLPI